MSVAKFRSGNGQVLNISIQPESPTTPDVAALVDAMYREEVPLYGETPEGRFPPLHLPPGRSVFLVARHEGQAVACGAVVPLDAETGELKRIYVRPEWRRRGVARQLLAELERRAAGMGYRRLRLETGIKQPAAIRLYERTGYLRIPCYGPYATDPLSVCFEKLLLQ